MGAGASDAKETSRSADDPVNTPQDDAPAEPATANSPADAEDDAADKAEADDVVLDGEAADTPRPTDMKSEAKGADDTKDKDTLRKQSAEAERKKIRQEAQ